MEAEVYFDMTSSGEYEPLSVLKQEVFGIQTKPMNSTSTSEVDPIHCGKCRVIFSSTSELVVHLDYHDGLPQVWASKTLAEEFRRAPNVPRTKRSRHRNLREKPAISDSDELDPLKKPVSQEGLPGVSVSKRRATASRHEANVPRAKRSRDRNLREQPEVSYYTEDLIQIDSSDEFDPVEKPVPHVESPADENDEGDDYPGVVDDEDDEGENDDVMDDDADDAAVTSGANVMIVTVCQEEEATPDDGTLGSFRHSDGVLKENDFRESTVRDVIEIDDDDDDEEAASVDERGSVKHGGAGGRVEIDITGEDSPEAALEQPGSSADDQRGDKTPFCCATCNNFFTSSRSLQDHLMDTHKKHDRLFKCGICRTLYLTVWGIDRHVKKEHAGKLEEGSSSKSGRKEARVATAVVDLGRSKGGFGEAKSGNLDLDTSVQSAMVSSTNSETPGEATTQLKSANQSEGTNRPNVADQSEETNRLNAADQSEAADQSKIDDQSKAASQSKQTSNEPKATGGPNSATAVQPSDISLSNKPGDLEKQEGKSPHPYGEIYECGRCDDVSFDKARLLELHVRADHGWRRGELFKCGGCKARFKTLGGLQTHLWKEHPLTGSKFRCNVCHIVFQNLERFRRHRRYHLTEEGQRLAARRSEDGDKDGEKGGEGNAASSDAVRSLEVDPKSNLAGDVTEKPAFANNGGVYACKTCKIKFYNVRSLSLHERLHGITPHLPS